ncbi:peptidase M6 [Halobacteriales archaeon Cl-PHB]
MVATATGGAFAAGAGAQQGAVDGGVLAEPVETGNDTATEYRGYEPTRDQVDKPVDLGSAPESFDGGDSQASTSGESAESSIVWDDSDEDPALVGTSKLYLGSDQSSYYFKEFRLVSIGDNVEVWVATDMTWPAGDSRPDPTITEQQAETMAQEFDEEMYPVESDVFGTPDNRTGTDALLSQLGVVPENYYETGNDSDRTVLLVDNVRDENYYDEDYPLYIAGFYSPTIQTYTDRNVITVDSYDWNAVQDGGLTGYEGTVAHELQHLIHADLDGDETSWVNEGMSDYAEVITGYGVPEGHLTAYEQSPSNELTNWEDQGAINVLADYGMAFTWTMYLEDQYGQGFISNLAKDEANGIAGVENTLNETGAKRDFYDLFGDFSTAVVTDGMHPPKDAYDFGNLDVDVNTSVDTGTAGVYGPAYQTIDTGDKGPITDVSVSGVDYVGTSWTTATDPVTGQGDVLYSGNGNLLNRHAIVEANLTGVEDPTLTFESYQRIESDWDYGFVQVSTDGGDTWQSLSNANTDNSPNPSAHPLVKENVPGLTGDTTGWESQSFDLSQFEGEGEVLVSFRYVTDWAFVEDGWWVKNVSVAGEAVATDTTEPYMSLREATKDPVEYQFSFIGVKDNGNYQVKQLDTRTFDESQERELKQFLHNGNFERVIVVSSWAAQQDESGRVPVAVDFDYAQEHGNGQGNGR